MKNILLLLLVLSPLWANAHTTLDPDFADQGTLIMKFDNPDVPDAAITGIKDYAGRYVSAGLAGGPASAQITRHMQDGTPDMSFGDQGVVRLGTYIGFKNSKWSYVAEQGKFIVVGGMLSSGHPLVCRFTEEGALDVSGFGIEGCRVIVIESSMPLRGMVVLADGSIVALLAGLDENKRAYALAKITRNGSIDTSFGDAECEMCGHVFSPLWMQDLADPRGLELDPSTGFLVVVAEDLFYDDIFVTKTSPGGLIDHEFGVLSGTAVINLNELLGFYGNLPIDISVESSGAIVVGAESSTQEGYRLAVARLRGDGSLDGEFGGGGAVGYQFPGATDARLSSIGIQPDGKILLAGRYKYFNSVAGTAVMRLRHDGLLDAGFGDGGTKFIQCGGCADTTGTFGPTVRYDDGRIVLFDTMIYPSGEGDDEAERFDPVIYRIKVENNIFADSFD